MQNYCGVDVSKDSLDCFILPDHVERFANAPEGFALLAGFVRKHHASMVVMEASGGLERLAYFSLWQQQVPCAVVNPRKVRDFAKALGHLEKTDRIDAAVIARFAAAMAITPMPAPSQNRQRLQALSARLRQVVGDLAIHHIRASSTKTTAPLRSSPQFPEEAPGRGRLRAEGVPRPRPRCAQGRHVLMNAGRR
jgi:transposase